MPLRTALVVGISLCAGTALGYVLSTITPRQPTKTNPVELGEVSKPHRTSTASSASPTPEDMAFDPRLASLEGNVMELIEQHHVLSSDVKERLSRLEAILTEEKEGAWGDSSISPDQIIEATESRIANLYPQFITQLVASAQEIIEEIADDAPEFIEDQGRWPHDLEELITYLNDERVAHQRQRRSYVRWPYDGDVGDIFWFRDELSGKIEFNSDNQFTGTLTLSNSFLSVTLRCQEYICEHNDGSTSTEIQNFWDITKHFER